MKAKRDLLITVDFPPMMGGLAVYLYNIWRRLPPEESVILAPQFEGDRQLDEKEPYRIYRRKYLAPQSWLWNIAKPFLLLGYSFSLLRKERVRVIHCGTLLQVGLATLILNWVYKVPYYLYVLGSEFQKYGHWIHLRVYMKLVVRRATKVIAISEFSKEETIRHTGIDPKKIILVTPGVDCQTFRPCGKDPELARRYHLENKKVILTVSRLDIHKGHDKVIEAFPSILQKVPEAVYLIVGAGPTENSLKALARKHRLEEKVIFAGFVPDGELPAFYNLCDIFVLATLETRHPVLIEGFGIVFSEASACGKPVVAGRTGGAVEAVKDNVSGLLVNPFKIEEIAEAVIRILRDPRLASSLGSQGRQRVLEQFRWDQSAEKIEALMSS